MKEITCRKIVLDWLKEQTNGTVIAHHIIDARLPEYGKGVDAYYSPATYHRNFCWLKNEPETLRKNGIELEQLVEGAGRVNKWKIKLTDQLEMLLS
jgi:hypothetical protein